ncbi:MAG: hypothetical protein H2057_07455 [Alphaproteobacteria bacterium]|nr:hypothetical protein [Alphaproteobacteria bacterium]
MLINISLDFQARQMKKLQIVEQMISRHEASLTKAHQQLADDQEQYDAHTQKSNVFSRNIPDTTKWMFGQYLRRIQTNEK